MLTQVEIKTDGVTKYTKFFDSSMATKKQNTSTKIKLIVKAIRIVNKNENFFFDIASADFVSMYILNGAQSQSISGGNHVSIVY